jgi:hypothetical protein
MKASAGSKEVAFWDLFPWRPTAPRFVSGCNGLTARQKEDYYLSQGSGILPWAPHQRCMSVRFQAGHLVKRNCQITTRLAGQAHLAEQIPLFAGNKALTIKFDVKSAANPLE